MPQISKDRLEQLQQAKKDLNELLSVFMGAECFKRTEQRAFPDIVEHLEADCSRIAWKNIAPFVARLDAQYREEQS